MRERVTKNWGMSMSMDDVTYLAMNVVSMNAITQITLTK